MKEDEHVQLHSPFPAPANGLPAATVLSAAMDETLMTRPGSSAVASWARRSVRLFKFVCSE